MSAGVDLTGSGLAVRDETGRTVATITVSTGPYPGEASLLVLADGLTLEIPVGIGGLKHLETVFGRNHREALFVLAGADLWPPNTPSVACNANHRS